MVSRDGIPELPTIDLDSPDDDSLGERRDDAPGPDDRRRTLARILTTALALALAFTLGVVITDARHTSSAQQDVSFVAGSPYRGGLGNPQGQREIRVNLPVVNTGTISGRVVGVDIRGFEVADDVGVDANPGQWTTIRTAVTPDCERRAGRELHLTVLTPVGRHETTIPLQSADSGLATIWAERCDARAVFGALVTTGVVRFDVTADQVATTIPLRTDLVEDIDLLDASSQAPGLSAEVAGLPSVLQPPQTHSLQLTWTVTDCVAARSLSALTIGVAIEIPERGVRPTMTSVSLPTETLVSMVRFVESQCPV
jgi:hypothetical protein